MMRTTSTTTATAAAAVVMGVVSATYYYYINSSGSSKTRTNKEVKKENSDNVRKGNNKNDDEVHYQDRNGCNNNQQRPPINQLQYNNNRSNSTNGTSNGKETAQPVAELFRVLSKNSITIVHGSVTGTCRAMAQELYEKFQQQQPEQRRKIQLCSIPELDWWDELINQDDEEEEDDQPPSSSGKSTNAKLPLLLILLPTYTEGSWTPPSEPLKVALDELANDWRIAKHPLKGKLQVGVLGIGSSAYDSEDDTMITMGRPAREAVRQFQTLGAKCLVRLQVGDVAVGNAAWDTYHDWVQQLLRQLQKQEQKQKTAGSTRQAILSTAKKEKKSTVQQTTHNGNKKNGTTDACGCHSEGGESHGAPENGGGCCQSSSNNGDGQEDLNEDNADEEENYDDDDDDNENDSDQEGGEPEIMDMEDMGDAMARSKANPQNENGEPKEMVTPSQAAALKKEGYKLIGTHSAVKLCRWTKHQLRGRGGCYKHTFYGITSYQCMEATPSLACANKCVFCWRHHKNPVGKEWRWKTDDPNFIVEEAVQTHIQMIQETKGIPGVRMDRWREAHTVRHCALSLVGEPIMYPRIHELLGALHQRKISTFLVTNGQHPAAIETLRPITQLYVSVDAPTKQSLIEIDRPLFRDAWERLRQSLQFLKDKGQRTVARLTVVKGWNSDELQGYAQLIALGHVSLVEVKGVTFCGKSDASNLNMSNTPWHHEVVALTQQLQQELDKLRQEQLRNGKGRNASENPAGNEEEEEDMMIPEYGLACEHQHSCSVLLARVDQFADKDPVTGKIMQWNTWIDYDKFHQLAARHAAERANATDETGENKPFTFSVRDYTAPTPAWALFGAQERGFDPTDTRYRKKHKHPKYTQFDTKGIPTHDHNDEPLPSAERVRLTQIMNEKLQELAASADGVETVTTQFADGSKHIYDPRNMFRGLVVTKG